VSSCPAGVMGRGLGRGRQPDCRLQGGGSSRRAAAARQEQDGSRRAAAARQEQDGSRRAAAARQEQDGSRTAAAARHEQEEGSHRKAVTGPRAAMSEHLLVGDVLQAAPLRAGTRRHAANASSSATHPIPTGGQWRCQQLSARPAAGAGWCWVACWLRTGVGWRVGCAAALHRLLALGRSC
jgi:hypothetical protein